MHFVCFSNQDTVPFSRREPQCSPQSTFKLACVHALYMNIWAAFVSLALDQVTRHGCTVCLMEILCRKRPCGSLEYVYIRNGILVSSPVCLIRLSPCDCKQTHEYSGSEDIPWCPGWILCILTYLRLQERAVMYSFSRVTGHRSVKCFTEMKYRTAIYYLLTHLLYISRQQLTVTDQCSWQCFIWDIIICSLRWISLWGYRAYKAWLICWREYKMYSLSGRAGVQ